MCSACAIIRPRSSKSAVEQSRRSLMLAEKAERMSTAPISSAIARRTLPMIWSSIVTFSSSRSVRPSLAPTHPGGSQHVAPASSTTAGPATVVRGSLRGRSSSGLGGRRRCAPRRARSSRSRIRVSVLLLVCAVERFRELVLQRHRQLERLARVAQIRFAFARQLTRVAQRDEVRAHRVAPLVARDKAERGQHACGLGDEHRAHPELVRERARVQRPGAAERDEREIARIVPALDRHDSQRTQHLRVDDVDDRRRIDPVERTLGGRAVELDAARELRAAAGRAAGSRR